MERKEITTFYLLTEAKQNAFYMTEEKVEKSNFIDNEYMKIMDGVLEKYTEEPGVTKVVIPEGVISIEDHAFAGCSNLTDIVIPKDCRFRAGSFIGCEKASIYFAAESEHQVVTKNIDCSRLKEGNIFEFGTYNGRAIKWKVLEMSEDGIVAITKDCICKKAYNEKFTAVAWKDCTLRTWLNENFYNNLIPQNSNR